MITPQELQALDPGYYWFHVTGPDGLDVMLVRVLGPIPGMVFIVDDDRTAVMDGNRMHKWDVHHVERIVTPAPVWP